MPRPLCLLVCQIYQREVEAVLHSEKWEDIQLQIMPPACHAFLGPRLPISSSSQGVKVPGCETIDLRACVQAVGTAAGEHDKGEMNITGLCIYQLAQRGLVDQAISQGGYLLTPGWLSQWPQMITSWGFDHQTAREFFKEFCQKLVLLDTGVDPTSAVLLSELGVYLDLPYESIAVNLDYYHLTIYKQITAVRQQLQEKSLKFSLDEANRNASDYAMAFDLLTNLTLYMNELKVVNKIIDIFTMLFSFNSAAYFPVIDDRVNPSPQCHVEAGTLADLQTWVSAHVEDYAWLPSGTGFLLRLDHLVRTVGVLRLDGMGFPEYKQQYLNLSLSIARLCGLVIDNARTYQDLQEAEKIARHEKELVEVLRKEAVQLATTDPLTGLYNRRFFFEKALTSFQRAQLMDRPLSVLMMDVDMFKQVNDTFGHAIGDDLLVKLAECCRQKVRDVDVVCRYGGEEFVILLPETDLEIAVMVGERLRLAISNASVLTEMGEIHIHVSIGAAHLQPGCLHLEDLLQRSDKALFTAKHAGGNCVHSWTPDLLDS